MGFQTGSQQPAHSSLSQGRTFRPFPRSAQLLSKYATSSPTGARGFPETTRGGSGAALARASLSSRRTTSGSRKPPADVVDDIEDVADRGVRGMRAGRAPASSGPPRRSVLIARPCSRSGFVRAAAAATLGGPPAPPAALGLPAPVCARGRGRRGGGKGAESALVSVSSPLPLPFPTPTPNPSPSPTPFVVLVCSLVCWVAACRPAERPIVRSTTSPSSSVSSSPTEIGDGDADRRGFMIGSPSATV